MWVQKENENKLSYYLVKTNETNSYYLEHTYNVFCGFHCNFHSNYLYQIVYTIKLILTH